MKKSSRNNLQNIEASGGMEFHALANIVPMMDEGELKALAEDIKKKGQRQTIKIYEGKILDGRNRYKACLLAGVKPKTEKYKGNDALDYVVSLNIRRRQLTKSQKAMAAARMANLERGDNQHASIDACSQTEAAQIVGIGRSAVQRAVQVLKKGIPELIEAVDSQKITVSAALKIIALEPEKQREIMKLGKKSEIRKAVQKIGQHPKDCSCEQCTDKKLRKNAVTVFFTDEELKAIDKAKSRAGYNDSRATFIQERVMDYCAEKNLPPSSAALKKWEKICQKSGKKLKEHYSEKDQIVDKSGSTRQERDEARVQENSTEPFPPLP